MIPDWGHHTPFILASYAIEPLRQLRESLSTERPVQKTPS